MGLTIYVRYQQVKEHPSTRNDLVLQRLNKVSLVLGLIAALGISLVGNFQVCDIHLLLSSFHADYVIHVTNQIMATEKSLGVGHAVLS